MNFLTLYLCICFLCLSRPGLGLDENKFCELKSEYFKVKIAFKAGDYIGLIGQVPPEEEEKASKAGQLESGFNWPLYKNHSVRIRYVDHYDPSYEDHDPYYETHSWPQLQHFVTNDNNTNAVQMMYGFSLNDRSVLNNQRSNSAVFIAYSNNTIWAVQLSVSEADQSDLATFNVLNATEVYNLDKDEDDSGLLTLKFLLLHFPPEVITINAILVFDRKMKGKVKHYFHALVYTTETFNGQTKYMRHYMRGTPHEYTTRPPAQQIPDRLEWAFDSGNDYCDELSEPVVAVLLLEKTSVSGKDVVEESMTADFVEFFDRGLKNRAMELHMNSSTFKMDIRPSNESDQSRDNRLFFSCDSHPIHETVSKIPCSPDYDNRGDVDQIDAQQVSGEEDNRSDSSSSFWLWLGILSSIVAIILLIAFGVYLLVGTDKYSGEETVADHSSDKKPNI